MAELESLYGSDKVQPAGDAAAVVDVDPCLLAFDRLGGAMKFCKLLTTLDTTNWADIEKILVQVSPGHSQQMPEGKMQLGLSTYGLQVTRERLMATGLSLKKAIKTTGRPVRLIPNKELELNTAQVEHNHLTGPNGWELVFVRDGNRTLIAQTVKVQGITSYTRRDRDRPKRDARVGMLPPKLAQIIINLAVGRLPDEARQSVCDIPPSAPIPALHFAGVRLLDPFCGTGVVLQEASLMGYDIYGSDIDQRMIDYADQNLLWLLDQPENRVRPVNADKRYYRLEIGDATNHSWQPQPTVVACETYLGRPFTSLPDPAVLAETISGCNLIIKKFLRNIHPQLAPGTRLCLAIPAWQIRPGQFKHLPLAADNHGTIDSLADMGYNRISFEHVSSEDLLYYREGQIVARQLLILQKS